MQRRTGGADGDGGMTYITDLPLTTIDRERAAIFVAEFLAWWDQAGRFYYGPPPYVRGSDEGLQNFAADAIDIAGGLTLARAIAPELTEEDATMERLEMIDEIAPPPTQGPAQPVAIRPTRERRKNAGDIENIFEYHPPAGDQQTRYIEIRAHAKVMARMLKLNCLESRELSLALTNLQQATMWANAAIAINEQPPATPADETDPDYEARRVDTIAKACHEANRQYCLSIGDTSQLPWEDAPDWQKASARAGVQAILDHPSTTPRQSHEDWLAHKAADGWVYGDVKDANAKTHPCMVPYDALPAEQRAKDAIFGAVARAVAGL